MTWDIQKLTVGERPTFLEADFGNEVIDALNKLGNVSIVAGDRDAVEYNAAGVVITYAKFQGGAFSGTFKVFDAEDVTKRHVVTVEENQVVRVTSEASGWEEKVVTICEDGSSVDVTFLVKS